MVDAAGQNTPQHSYPPKGSSAAQHSRQLARCIPTEPNTRNFCRNIVGSAAIGEGGIATEIMNGTVLKFPINWESVFRIHCTFPYTVPTNPPLCVQDMVHDNLQGGGGIGFFSFSPPPSPQSPTAVIFGAHTGLEGRAGVQIFEFPASADTSTIPA